MRNHSKLLIVGAAIASLLASASASFAQVAPAYDVTSLVTGEHNSQHHACVWVQPSAGNYGLYDSDKDPVTGVTRVCIPAFFSVSQDGKSAAAGGGGGGSLSATASASPTPVVAGTNKPLNIGLFSNLFITPVTPAGAQVDLNSPSTLMGSDGSTIMTAANPLEGHLNAGTALVGKVGLDQTTQGTTNGVAPLPTAAMGCLLSGTQSAASTNATNVKNAAGTLCGGQLINTTAVIYYLRLYNLAAAPTCSSATGYVLTVPIPVNGTSGGGVLLDFGAFGGAFSTGISFCLTGGPTSTDNTNAATGVFVNLGYK